MPDAIFILAVLCTLVLLTEWLVKHTFFRHFGTALLVILVTAIVANLGLIPAGSSAENPVPVYDAIFGYVAPIAIFLLLLPVSLRDILKAGKPLISLFLIGAMGTAVGVTLGMWLLNGPETIGEHYVALGGMFTGTYTGGGINFNALALHYNIVEEGVLYGGAVAVDNIMTAIWMMVCIAIPRLFGLMRKKSTSHQTRTATDQAIPESSHDQEKVTPFELAALLALSLSAQWFASYVSNWLATFDIKMPSIILISVLALVIAQIPFIQRINGARVLGYFAVTLFLSVIGAFCDLSALGSLGQLGITLFFLVVIIVTVHGLFVFGSTWIFRLDPDLAAVASQANIGGPPSALALAKSLGRSDLVLPAILIGSLGYAVGTFIGLGLAEWVLTGL